MKRKAVTVERTLLLCISLTGDSKRDELAIEACEELTSLLTTPSQMRDMVSSPHTPFIFIKNEKGVFSHSMVDNILSIWEEKFSLEDID